MVTNPDTINPKAFSQKSCHLCLKMECLCHNHYNVFMPSTAHSLVGSKNMTVAYHFDMSYSTVLLF